MIALDVIAPILLMIGLKITASSNAALLNNFEIVATSLVAMLIFKEKISWRLWLAILIITFACILLSFDNVFDMKFSYGSVFILGAAVCWGFENNCTRKISSMNTFMIVFLKGISSSLCSFVIALIIGERLPQFRYIAYAVAVGFVAYGLSIFLYVRAQKTLGAAQTSAYYAISPFIGAFLSFIILKEALESNYLIAFILMVIGSGIVVYDSMRVHRSR